MRKHIYTIFCLLIVASLSAQVNKIKDAGPDDKRINFAVVGDGYTASQLGDFSTDAMMITEDFFNEVPFLQYTNFFNVYTVDVVSQESGADHPNIEGSTSHPQLSVNTALDGTFDAFGIHRLVVVDNAKVFAQLAANYPNYDQAVILVNSPFYGGSGGATAVNTLHSSASDLAIHEVGHSFQNLADEYADGGEAPNRTSVNNAGNVRWQDWIGMGGVGEFTIGSSSLKPVDGACMMEFLNQPFCPVCIEQTIESIYDLVSPLESTSPATANVDYTGEDLDFAITTIKPIPNTLTYEWELNGQPFTNGVEAITLTQSDLTEINNTLLVRVKDETTLSMKNANYVFTYEWTISNLSLPLEWESFTAIADDKSNRLDWTITQPENSSHFLVERQRGSSWEVLDRLPFTGATNYTYFDEFPLEGSNFYRIKAVDFDDSSLYSPIREVRNVLRTYFRAYPTVTSGPLAIEVYTDGPAERELQVFSAEGRVLQKMTLSAEGGWVREQIDLSDLAPGTYVIRVAAGRETYTQRIMVGAQ